MNRQRAAEKALHDQTNILPFGQLMVVFSGLATSLLITVVDQNGISVTLPTIARDLGAQNTISWAGTSSLIANTMFTVLYGRLSDIFGRKIVYISALTLLCIANLLCGLSQTPAMFYVFRGLAGVAGGGVTSLTMIIVSDIVTLEKRGKYQGILGASLGVGNIIGPFLAAAFIMRSTWRGFFWMISPLAACSAVVGYFLIPNNAHKERFRKNMSRIDWFGVLASSIGIIFILIPISGGGSYFPWDSAMVISMLVIGSCSFVVFGFVEWKVASLPMFPSRLRSPKPMPDTFRRLNFSCFLQEQGDYRSPPAELSSRGCVSIISLLLASLLPECAWLVPDRVCGPDHTDGRLSVTCVHCFWPVHFATQALWRDYLGWLWPLDLVSCDAYRTPFGENNATD